MKRILILIIGLIGVAQAQYAPTSAKSRFVNGLALGTKLDSYFNAADSNAIYWRADSVVMAKYKGAARALAFASALGSYKLVADTFFTTGYTTRIRTKLTIDSLANSTNFIYPEMYGAVGDLVTNDRAALQSALNAAIAAKKTLVLKGSYFIDSTITVNEGASILGSGSSTTGSIRITANLAAFNINGSNVLIRGVSFVGSGNLSGYTYNNQHAIRVYGSADLLTSKSNVIISDCGFYEMAGAGVYITANVGSSFFEGGVQVSNSFATGSSIGFFTDVRGEYNSFTNCYAWNNNVGWRNAGGNNRWVAGQLTGNTTGAYIEGGPNNAHGKLLGAAINHNVDYAVWSSGVTLGMDIDNCNIYDNDIYIQNSVGIKFNGNDISLNVIYFENSSRLEFMNNKYVTTPTFDTTFNSTTSTYRFFNETFWSTVPSIIKNTLPQKLVVNDSIMGNSIKRAGGTSSQFLKADGSVDANTYLTTSAAAAGYVDLSTNQTVAGEKTFTGDINSVSRVIFETTSSPNAAKQDGYNATVGRYIYPKAGSVYDYTLYNSVGNPVLLVPTGTANVNILGTATVNSIVKSGGTSTQALIADGSVQTLTSGIYLPTASNVSNTSAITIDTAQYIRVGNVVTVSGRIVFTNTLNSPSQISITLPISTVVSAVGNVAGTGNENVAMKSAIIRGRTGTNDALLEVDGLNSSTYTIYYTYIYRVL